MDASLAEPNSARDEHEKVAASRLTRGVFVGREQTIAELDGLWKEVLDGDRRTLALVLRVAHVPARARVHRRHQDEARRERGRRHGPRDGDPPLFERLPEHLQAAAVELRQLVEEQNAVVVPELRDGAGGVEQPPPSLEPEHTRFTLFDAVTVVLKGAAAREPLVLVLDDLHGADPPSLALLHFLSRELRDARILLIGSYRDVEARRKFIEENALDVKNLDI